MNTTTKPSAGIVLPALVGAVLCWLPATIFAGEQSALFTTLVMPAWTVSLWWACVARCELRAQRVGIPLVTLVVVWFIGPLFLGQASGLLYGPATTFIGAAYSGSLFGLLGLSGALVMVAILGVSAGAGQLVRAGHDPSATPPGS